MTRRFFYRLLTTGMVGMIGRSVEWGKSWTKPSGLRSGDAIGLITPGSPVHPEKIEQSVITCQRLGLRPVLGKYVQEENGYLAGTDQQRLEDLHTMFTDPEINGIWCIRGGYGCTRLLPHIDFDLIRQHPKVFAGYSDITALHLAIGSHSQLVTFHAPVASSNPTDYTIEMFKNTVMKAEPDSLSIWSTTEAHDKMLVFREGIAQGSITGGNLSLLAALAGTPWSPNYSGKIVCIEDIGEKPYRIDRMLVQLFQATDLAKAAGVILGQFKDCEAKPGEKSLTLEQTLRNQFAEFAGPVIYGFSFGHIDDQCTLPFGINARFETTDQKIHLLESPIQ